MLPTDVRLRLQFLASPLLFFICCAALAQHGPFSKVPAVVCSVECARYRGNFCGRVGKLTTSLPCLGNERSAVLLSGG